MCCLLTPSVVAAVACYGTHSALVQATRNRKDFQENLPYWTKLARRKKFPNAECAYRNTAPSWVYLKLCAEAKQILNATP